MRLFRQRGASYIDALVATLVLSVSIAGLVSTLGTNYNMTRTVDENGITTAIARRAIENVRALGFSGATEGTTTEYYDANGSFLGQVESSSDVYQVNTVVTSDEFQTSQGGGSVPGDFSLRTVVVTVYSASTGTSLYTVGTYLTRGGL